MIEIIDYSIPVVRLAVFALPIIVAFVLSSDTLAFAETNYEIKIPSGASDPGAPFFWSEKTTGVTTGIITIYPGDSVTWKNADTAFHTITSVSQSGEENGLFDSGLFTAGDSYTRQFNELGDFYYYCNLHLWMNGVVHVIKNPGSVQSIFRVASGYSDDGLGFEVKYILDTHLADTVHVDPNGRSLTFTIPEDTENEQITMILPPKLIENPNTVWVDGEMVNIEIEETATGSKLIIPIKPHSKEIKVMGSYVIPEFGFLTMTVLSIGIFSTLFVARSKFSFLR
ncbi:plastocyanin/azurin family copper-binding protein [Nitrosopumilus ureiphilus]|uniref:plastocyanin/azurin family copper-binding protein n=1 Tax=Nitrosopumilus ureiphilus TaxID=1470067 RepID=UPI001FEB19CE|nr:plastocyanin/azurin family copper-binding protein [Nitrosopumilus ureiphilus]